MNETRATVAIVRRHLDRRFALDWLAQAAIVAVLAFIFAPGFGSSALVALGALAALAVATAVERQHVASLRRVSFFSVPLFGRQLARAHAIAPSLAALALPIGYAIGAAVRGVPIGAERFTVAACVVVIATLVALSAIFRDGRDRALYVAIAFGAAFVIATLTTLPTPHAARIAAVVAIVIGFLALRAFGETLARYDPLPEETSA